MPGAASPDFRNAVAEISVEENRWYNRRARSKLSTLNPRPTRWVNPRPRAGGDVFFFIFFSWLLFQSTPPRGGRPSCGRWATHPARFQSTPPRGGRPDGMSGSPVLVTFQSTPPRGGRPAVRSSLPTTSRFNPRPRAGGDQARQVPRADRAVSIHAPARGATPTPVTPVTACRFNPRPRAGGDRHAEPARPTPGVSIHAPARGATGPAVR